METDPVAKVVPIDDLSVDPGNLRTHDARSDSGIEASLKRFGPARSIVVDGKGVVRAGNGTLEAARRAGITDVLVVEPKPGQLVAVRRSDWSPSEATGYAISDNRLTDLSAFDPDGLARTLRALQDEDFDLGSVGFTDAEVDALFGVTGDDGTGDGGSGETPDPAEARKSLADRFGVPPFSVLDARQGYWQDRKRAWLSLGIQSELGRGGDS
jgi:hypothetical protein